MEPSLELQSYFLEYLNFEFFLHLFYKKKFKMLKRGINKVIFIIEEILRDQ